MADTKLVICEKCWGTGYVNGGGENSTWSKTCEDCHGIGFVRVPKTNADRIRAMSDDELADFFFESPEIEFTVCEYCEYFGGHTSDTPCKHDMGRCFVLAKNEAFKKWLKQPAE